MGDRCNVQLELRGEIRRLEDFDEIVHALEQEAASSFDTGLPYSASGIAAFLVQSAEAGEAPLFEFYEVNYGDISDVENALQAMKQPYHATHTEGGNYSACEWSWMPGRGRTEFPVTNGSGLVVPVDDLTKMLKESDVLDQLRKIVAEAGFARGNDLPPFSIEGSTLAAVKERIAAARQPSIDGP